MIIIILRTEYNHNNFVRFLLTVWLDLVSLLLITYDYYIIIKLRSIIKRCVGTRVAHRLCACRTYCALL
jgi:hypothetical protein